jgi:hypothetical protein
MLSRLFQIQSILHNALRCSPMAVTSLAFRHACNANHYVAFLRSCFCRLGLYDLDKPRVLLFRERLREPLSVRTNQGIRLTPP